MSFEFDDAEPELPLQLSPYRMLGVEDDEIAYFPSRHGVRIESIRRLGAWEPVRPYIVCVIGADALVDVLPTLLDALPLFLGHDHCGTFFMATDGVPPLMARP